jgi:hypothetical protein
VDPPHRVPGVDYARLEERLARADFRVADYIWARNLAGVHAFLSLW